VDGFNKTGGELFETPQFVSDSPISVSISPNIVELDPGKSVNVTATFILKNFNGSELPVYSGWILVNSSAPEDGGTLQIPFMGVATSMFSLPIYDTSIQMPWLSTVANAGLDYPPITTDGSIFSLTNDSTTPSVNCIFLFGPRVLRMDILLGNGNTAETTPFAGLDIIG
jgi:hypothetical protein